MPQESRHHCNPCNKAFSITVGKVFHGSRIDLQKWIVAIILNYNSDNKISVRKLAEAIQVNKNTAHRMLTLIRAHVDRYGLGQVARNVVAGSGASLGKGS